MTEKKVKAKAKPKKNLGFLKHFITNNVNPPQKGFVTKFWPREMRVAKELYKQYPNEEFWKKFQIGFKVNSLAWFKMYKGEALLKRKYQEFHYVPTQQEDTMKDVSDSKVGESRVTQKPRRTLKDLLD